MNTNTTTNQTRRETCATCLFCMMDRIPDPNATYNGKEKPKVDGYRCHVARPTTNGFPIVNGDGFCALWTDKTTKEQPLARYLNPFYMYRAGDMSATDK